VPGLDGTGPRGQGALTGGGRGRCAGARTADTSVWGHGPGVGRGLGRGCGYGAGRGFRNQYNATGLTGWQRARMGTVARAPETQTDRIAGLETRLDEALARLARLEGTE
jgi:hypothetical protein